jgi:hypothetical protein
MWLYTRPTVMTRPEIEPVTAAHRSNDSLVMVGVNIVSPPAFAVPRLLTPGRPCVASTLPVLDSWAIDAVQVSAPMPTLPADVTYSCEGRSRFGVFWTTPRTPTPPHGSEVSQSNRSPLMPAMAPYRAAMPVVVSRRLTMP